MNSGGVLWSWATGIFDPCRFHAWLFVNKVVCTCNLRCICCLSLHMLRKRIKECDDEENLIWECFYSEKTCVKGHRFSEVPHLRNPPIACTFLYADIRSNSTTPRRVALARMFKEAGLRSPRTQLTKVKIEISVLGRRTEATLCNACWHDHWKFPIYWLQCTFWRKY